VKPHLELAGRKYRAGVDSGIFQYHCLQDKFLPNEHGGKTFK
jgi:hypothetical protein